MKRLFILLTLVLTMFSAVAFANVDSGPDRWKLIGSDKMAKVYYDRETGKFKGFGNPLYSRDTTEEKEPYEEASQEEIEKSIKQIIIPLNTFTNQLVLRDYIQAASI